MKKRKNEKKRQGDRGTIGSGVQFAFQSSSSITLPCVATQNAIIASKDPLGSPTIGRN